MDFIKINNTLSDNLMSTLNYDTQFISPLSINSVMLLLLEGSSSETRQQLLNYFKISEATFISVKEQYSKLMQIFKANGCKLINNIYIRDDLVLDKMYAEIANSMGKIENVPNFEAPGVREYINKFVADNTNNLIPELIEPEMVSRDQKIAIVNVLYFKNSWKYNFGMPFSDSFNTINGKKECKLMSCLNHFNYYENNSCQVVEIEYSEDYSMVIFLPKIGIAADPHAFANIVFQQKHGSVTIPEFEINSKYMLKSNLQKLGVSNIFSNSDLSKMFQNNNTFIDDIVHKCVIKVDRFGTEAAAATATTSRKCLFEPPKPDFVFIANHTFQFSIKHRSSGLILFCGIYNG